MQHRRRVPDILEDTSNHHDAPQLVIEMTVGECAGPHFSGFEHCDRHRLFHAQRAVRSVAQWYYLEFPGAKVRRLKRVLRQTKIVLDDLSGPAFVLMPGFPNSDAVLIGKRPQIFAGEQSDASETSAAFEALSLDCHLR